MRAPDRRRPAHPRRGLAGLVALALTAPLAGSAALADVGPFQGGPSTYFTTSDGTDVALSVVYPAGFDPARRYPAILEIAGYENGSASPDGRTAPGQALDLLCAGGFPCPPEPDSGGHPVLSDSHGATSAFRYARDGYVVVHASLPGTGCSSGRFSLYSFDAARAGYEVIEDFIVRQPWSNGKVGILGHSYSGMTGLLVAAHEGLAAREGRPHHLDAVTLSGLVDDVYRGITFPGGVLNSLFPPLWHVGLRPFNDVAGGTVQGVARNAGEEEGTRCARNAAARDVDTADDPLVEGVRSQGLDNEYWRRVSLLTYAPLIDVPIHITGTFQDQQTGARFPTLWEAVPAGVPKRLLLANGDHDTNVVAHETWADRKAWMDHWLRGIAPDPAWGWTDPTGAPEPSSVRVLFEVHAGPGGAPVSNGRLDATSFPVEGTSWVDFLLCGGRTITTDPSACMPGSDTYVSGSRRQSWNYQAGPGAGPPLTTADAPDQIELRSAPVPAGAAVAVAGPALATLYLSTLGNDTDLFVQVIDEDTAVGTRTWLQRGWLKASHRAVDPARSDRTDVDPRRPGFVYRPYRPHDAPQAVTPRIPVEYVVELWPFAHVFRPGHRLVVVVTAPPAVDSDYSFAVPSNQPAALNTLVYGDGQHPSRVTLPVVPLDAIDGLGAAGPGCPGYWHVRCVRPAA